jgi:tetratricopeptide (TPR) repeat protein
MARRRQDQPPNPLLRAAQRGERRLSLSGSGRVMSRQELAEAVNTYLWDVYQQRENLDENHIGKLERGEHRWPGERRREAFRAVLHAEADSDLGFYITRGTRRVGPDSVIEETDAACDDAVIVKIVVDGHVHTIQLSRRGLFEAVTGSLAAPLLAESPTQMRAAVDPAVVDHFAALRALLVDSDNRLGAASVLPTARHQLGLIAQLRRQTRGSLHEQLLRTEARWAEFAGWLSDDVGDRAAGVWWLSQSITMAQEANDLDFSAYLFARMAQRAADGADEDRVLGLAQAATRVVTTHPHVRAFAALQQALSHAVARERYLFQSAISDALTLIEDHTAQHGDLGSFCTTPYVIAQEGEGWLRLSRPKTAAKRFGQALAIWPAPFQRDRGLYLSRAAAAQLASKEPDEAATTALEALKLADATRSTRIRREVVALGQRLTPFEDRPAVTALLPALAPPTPVP